MLLVLIYHCGGVLNLPNYIHGEIGVDVFLILSGFALAAYSADTPLRDFAQRRFLRIYPSYWLALALFLWVDWYYLSGPRPWEDIWQHIIGIQAFSRLDYFADFSDSFWFVSLILAAYIVFACIRRRLDNLSLVFAVCGFFTVLATVLYQINGHQGGYVALSVRIPSFFAGVVAGRLLGAGTAEIRFNLALGLGLACFYYLTFYRGITCAYTIPAIGIILTWMGLRPYLARFPEGRILKGGLSLLGLVSYEVYLFHQPIIRDCNLYVYHVYLGTPSPTNTQLLLGILIGLAVTLVISVAVHLAVGWGFSFLRKRPAPQARAATA